jgi:hypothetical protein
MVSLPRWDIQIVGMIGLMFLLIFEVIRGLDCEERGGTMRHQGAWYSCIVLTATAARGPRPGGQ